MIRGQIEGRVARSAFPVLPDWPATWPLTRRGYGLLISAGELDEENVVDGLIVVGPDESHLVLDPVRRRIRVLTVGHPCPGPSRSGGRRRPPELRCGAARARQLFVSSDFGVAGLPRQAALVRAGDGGWIRRLVRKSGIEPLVLRCSDDGDVIERVLEDPPPPSFIIGMLDRQAAAAQRAVLATGLSVSKDVVIASGFDGQILELMAPSISAIDANSGIHGAVAVRLLADWIEQDSEPPKETRIDLRLMTRQSTQKA